MSREEALKVLRGVAEISYNDLDHVFRAFGFISATPDFETEVYYHPTVRCGRFTARDDGIHVLSPDQRALIAYMIQQVIESEHN